MFQTFIVFFVLFCGMGVLSLILLSWVIITFLSDYYNEKYDDKKDKTSASNRS